MRLPHPRIALRVGSKYQSGVRHGLQQDDGVNCARMRKGSNGFAVHEGPRRRCERKEVDVRAADKRERERDGGERRARGNRSVITIICI